MATNICKESFFDKNYKLLSSNNVTIRLYKHAFTNLKCYVLNENKYSVKVKCVTQASGEITEWIEIFEPGEKKFFKKLHFRHAFYIYDSEDKLLGFIKKE